MLHVGSIGNAAPGCNPSVITHDRLVHGSAADHSGLTYAVTLSGQTI